MKLIEKLKEFNVDNKFDYNQLKNNVSKWPKIINNNGEETNLSGDDFEYIKLTEKTLTVKCNSDWHPPYKIKIKLNYENNLEVYDCRLSDFGIDEYISINNILNK